MVLAARAPSKTPLGRVAGVARGYLASEIVHGHPDPDLVDWSLRTIRHLEQQAGKDKGRELARFARGVVRRVIARDLVLSRGGTLGVTYFLYRLHEEGETAILYALLVDSALATLDLHGALLVADTVMYDPLYCSHDTN